MDSVTGAKFREERETVTSPKNLRSLNTDIPHYTAMGATVERAKI